MRIIILPVLLHGLIALAITSPNPQGQFNGVTGWGSGNGNPSFNPNPDNNNDGDGNGDGSGSGSESGGGSGSANDSSNGNGDEIGSGNGNGNSDGNILGGGNSGSNGGSSSGSLPGMGGFKNGTRYRGLLTTGVAHGVLAGISFAFLFPLGAILLRVIPGKGAVASHVFAQMLAYLLYISAAALGLYLVSNLRSPSGGSLLDNASTNAHPLIGIVLLVVVVFQPTLGVLHHRRFEKFKRRTWVSYVHIGVGRLAIPLGIINGGLGLQLAGTTGAAVIAYGIVSAIMFILWVIATLTRRTQDATGQEKEESPKVIQEQERDQVGRRASPRVEAPRPEGDGSARLPTAAAAAVPVAEQDMPSPPYTPGPHYAAHMAQVLRQQQPNQDGGGVQSMKEGMGTYEIMLADAEEMRRGQV